MRKRLTLLGLLCLAGAVQAGEAGSETVAPGGKPLALRQPCAQNLHAKSPPEELKAGGHACLVVEDWSAAIGIYTKLLNQPDVSYHREALEMLGLARERNGQRMRARMEYEKYLAMYPEGEGTERVRLRLDGLVNADQKPKPKLAAPVGDSANATWETFGDFGQYYFRDAFLTDSQGEQVDQSLFLSVLDVNSRYRDERFDVKAQFNGRYRYNFLDVVYNENDQLRVANAYVDVVDRDTGVSGRLGRQSRSSGGVMGRFDGGVLSYRFNPQWQLSVLGGFPVLPYRSTAPDTQTSFEGVSVEVGPFLEHWAGNAFFINQQTDGVLGRRAFGGEVRYLDRVHPVFTLFDYDVYFNKLNTAQIVANWNFPENSTLTVTADYRKTPYLSTNNALIGWGSGYGPGTGMSASSISQILLYQPTIDLKSVAADNTATFRTVSVSGITPLTKHYSLNGDITVTDLSATQGSIWVTPYQGSGTQVSYGAQLIAMGLFEETDVWNIGTRWMTQQIDDIFSLFVDGRYPINADIRLDPRLRTDLFTGYAGPDVWRIRPGLRFNYQMVRKLFLELEGGFEYMNKPQIENELDTKGYYTSVGYRWEF